MIVLALAASLQVLPGVLAPFTPEPQRSTLAALRKTLASIIPEA